MARDFLIAHRGAVGAVLRAAVQHVRLRVNQDPLIAAPVAEDDAHLMPAAGQLDRILAEARQWAQPVSFPRVQVCVSALGPEACLVGTGELARRAACQGGAA